MILHITHSNFIGFIVVQVSNNANQDCYKIFTNFLFAARLLQDFSDLNLLNCFLHYFVKILQHTWLTLFDTFTFILILNTVPSHGTL